MSGFNIQHEERSMLPTSNEISKRSSHFYVGTDSQIHVLFAFNLVLEDPTKNRSCFSGCLLVNSLFSWVCGSYPSLAGAVSCTQTKSNQVASAYSFRLRGSLVRAFCDEVERLFTNRTDLAMLVAALFSRICALRPWVTAVTIWDRNRVLQRAKWHAHGIVRRLLRI